MQTTRLQRHWKIIESAVLKRWNELSSYDLDGVRGNMDRLVDLIRKRYAPERSPFSIEAEIRDWIILQIEELERRESFM